jgi:sulfatase maturation enzyme AslB (radical SAM superfamily)
MEDKKEFLLKESKVFCMFPWLHLNVTPKGDIYPCCSNSYTEPIGNTKTTTLDAAFNLPEMKQLRLDMLNNKPSDACGFCYKHEKASPYSFRTYSIEQFSKHYDELIPQTAEDGTVEDFKMRYFDIRFSNICNFKCRTCGAEFSSQWAKENRIHNKNHPILFHADDGKGKLLEEVLTHIDHIDLAYFAGGEPLITEEHYIMLEEMIRRGRTDIVLRYNTNASNIKYKDYDILDLWKRFKKVELSCSVDHYGDRAEWLRHGTNWGEVESNLLLFRNLDYIDFQINTVFSIFNYLTITEFYDYLKSKDIIRPNDWHHSLYLAVFPPHYSARNMPTKLKNLATEKANLFVNANADSYKLLSSSVQNGINFANEENTWKDHGQKFLELTNNIDKIRGEDFLKVFPELTEFIDLKE